MRRALLPILILAALGGPATADDFRVDDHPFEDLDHQVGVGYLGGGTQVGGLTQDAFGVALAAGIRRDRWLYLAEYDGLGLDDEEVVGGWMHRLGAFLRRDVGVYGGDLGPVWAGGTLWLEAGLGHQRVNASSGARLDRTDLGLGIGGDFSIVWRDGERSFGISYAARFLVARAPDEVGMQALCTGGCEIGGQARRDVGIFFGASMWMGK